MIVRVPQRDPGLQQLQDAEGGELADPAVARVRRQHGETVERAQELGPSGPRVARRVLHEAHVVLVDGLELARGTELAAAAIDAAYVPYVRERTPVAVTDEDQDAAQRQVAVELPWKTRHSRVTHAISYNNKIIWKLSCAPSARLCKKKVICTDF